MQCKICGGPSAPVFRGLILRKHDIQYFRCDTCDFLQTEEPYWLDEAYQSAISDLDLGPVNRAVTGSRMVESVITTSFDPNASFIDWGGGYGVFTRLMRDNGFDFYWRDPYCANLFAKQFVAQAGVRYELMTCFEVFEHLVQPLSEIDQMLGYSGNIYFTTLIPPQGLTASDDWWYLTPEHGQHIAIYSMRTLRWIANRFGLHLTSDGSATHLFSQKPVSGRLFSAIVRDRRAAQVIRRVARRRLNKGSLLMEDFRKVTGWKV